MTEPRPLAAAPAPGYSRATWIVLGLAVVLYYFRFRVDTVVPDAMMSLYLMSPDASAGACLMKGERLAACSTAFPYPPLFALLTVPFTFLPMEARNIAWYAVLVAATYGCFRICEALVLAAFRVTREELTWVRVLSTLLSLKFVLSVLENQAYDVLVFFFILVGLQGLARDRTAAAASGLGTAVALKPTPLIMLAYALWLRNWKVFALGTGVCVLLSLLPDLLFRANYPGHGYLWTWVRDVAIGGVLGTTPDIYYPLMKEVNFLNQSLKSLVFMTLDGTGLAAHKRAILYGVYGVYAAVALAILIRSAKAEGALLWGASIGVISMVLLSPVSSKSHFVVLLLPHMAIVAYLVKHPEARRAVVPLLCASFFLNSLVTRHVVGRGLAILMQSYGCITFGTLLLLAAVAVAVNQSGKTASARTA